MSFLLDTHALSEVRKIRLGRADSKVAAWSEHVSARDLFVSVITLQEIDQGLLQLSRLGRCGTGLVRKCCRCSLGARCPSALKLPCAAPA